jgi:hypothetical protein
MIDFLKITNDLSAIDLFKIFFTIIIFLFLIMSIFAVCDRKEKFITIFILVLMILATFYGTQYIGIRQYVGMKEALKKAEITNIKNLKRNRKIVEDSIKYNGAIKNKEEYINTLLNKFYLNGKDATPDEKELMKKLKK